jgi:hypothetical protein
MEIAASAQTSDQAAEEPTEKYLRLLRAAITSGRVHVAGVDGCEPLDRNNYDDGEDRCIASIWGWRRDPQGDWRAQGTRVGWLDGQQLYLEPEATHAAVHEMARAQGEGFALGPRAVRKRLMERGLLVRTTCGRGTTVRKSLGGVNEVPVLHLRVQSLLQAGHAEERGAGASAFAA